MDWRILLHLEEETGEACRAGFDEVDRERD